jgi:putative membrane protein
MRVNTTASLIVVAAALAFGCNRESTDPNDPKSKEVPVEAGKTTSISEDGREFVMSALRNGMLGVEASKIAQTRASDETVKSFAGKMVEQHGKANDELTTLARKHSLVVPTTLSDDGNRKLEKLRDESAADFDEQYLELMVDTHKDAVDIYEKQMKRDQDAELQQWASKTVPTLRAHHDEAKRYKEAVDEKDDLIKNRDLVNPDGTLRTGTTPGPDAATAPPATRSPDPMRAPGTAH